MGVYVPKDASVFFDHFSCKLQSPHLDHRPLVAVKGHGRRSADAMAG